ncbi:UNVERIFIED_CONTAM: hypothetical protein ABIC26_003074 [Paenibacillus sp. PvR008]
MHFLIPNIHATARIVEGCGLFAIFRTIPDWSLPMLQLRINHQTEQAVHVIG